MTDKTVEWQTAKQQLATAVKQTGRQAGEQKIPRESAGRRNKQRRTTARFGLQKQWDCEGRERERKGQWKGDSLQVVLRLKDRNGGGDFRSDESDRLSGKTTEFDSRKLLQLKFDMQFNDCEHGHENEIEIETTE